MQVLNLYSIFENIMENGAKLKCFFLISQCCLKIENHAMIKNSLWSKGLISKRNNSLHFLDHMV